MEDEEDEDVEEEELIEDKEEEEGDDENDHGLVDELCEGLSKIIVNEKGQSKEFVGKHTRTDRGELVMRAMAGFRRASFV